MARADYYTQTTVIPESFSDFLDNFNMSPVSGDLARITNEESDKQTIRNLVLTSLGERPFQSTVGSGIYGMMFENFTGFTADEIKAAIVNTITQNDSRIVGGQNSLNVDVIPSADQNSMTVNIIFYLTNNPNPINLQLVIQRVR